MLLIEDLGYTVYLDWRDDPSLDRKHVTPTTAARLREQMKASNCLFYAVTPSTVHSVWMKWELGYKDGDNGKIAILPIVGSHTEAYSSSEEFVGLYPYVSGGTSAQDRRERLWIHHSPSIYVEFEAWLSGKEPSKRN